MGTTILLVYPVQPAGRRGLTIQAGGAAFTDNGDPAATRAIYDPVADATNGTPRTGLTTDPRTIAAYAYIWGRRYLP